MEDTDMIKKKYMQPALEILQAEVVEMVATSVTDIKTSGLDDNLNIDGDNKEGDPWEIAW